MCIRDRCIPAKLVFRVFGLSAEAAVTEEDLLSMVDDAEEDVIDEERKEMIANIVELDDVTAGDIMTHRTELVSVEDTATTGEAVHLAAQAGVSRLPVYRRSIDDVAGILHAVSYTHLRPSSYPRCPRIRRRNRTFRTRR